MKEEKTSFICQQNEEGKYGYANPQGEVIIPFEYDVMWEWYEKEHKAFFVVKKNKKYGVVDSDGKAILPFEYDWICRCVRNTSNTKFLEIKKEGKLGLANEELKILLDCKYDDICVSKTDNGKIQIDVTNWHIDWRTELVLDMDD